MRHRAPTTADVEKSRPRAEFELASDEVDLAALGLLECVLGGPKTAHEYVIDGPSTIS